MNYEKTGRLIKRKRQSLGLNQAQFAEAVGVTPQAVSLWERGKRFPDADAQVMLFKAASLNPVELISGLEMYDEELKKKIAHYMDKIDKEAFVAGMCKDEDGNAVYLNLSQYFVDTSHKDGDLAGDWVPYTEYHNVEPVPEWEDPNIPPLSAYNPKRVYINHHDCIFVIPIEILMAVGKPLYFNIIHHKESEWVGFRFTDELEKDGFDIPEKVYNGKWKGVHVYGGEFGRMLCKAMGIRRRQDLIEIEPEYVPSQRAIILPLDKTKRVNVDISYQDYLLPQWQYDDLWAEDEEEFPDDQEE